MKKLLLIFSLLTSSLFAESCKTLFTGAAAYKAGDFTSAAEAWQNCVDNGYQNGDLYYNLGNAYFRENRLGLAILNYEKALRFDPTNDDYEYNLKFARSMTKDKVEESEDMENPILNFAFEAHHVLSEKQQFIGILHHPAGRIQPQRLLQGARRTRVQCIRRRPPFSSCGSRMVNF